MFSIIIPTCNRNDLLSQCLDQLNPLVQAPNGYNYEVIVTDDSNNLITAQLIKERYNWVKWIEGPKKGPAANRNNGAKYAHGEWLIFLDDDCLPDAHILKEYCNALSLNPGIQVFEGCISTDRNQQSFAEESPVNESGGYLWSCNFMINKSLFVDKLKGFDEGFPFPAMEDVDLDYRLRKLGCTIIFIKNALVVHPWRVQKKMYAVTMRRFESLLYFLGKHPEMRKKLNSKYYLHMVMSGVKSLFVNSVKFKFKGFGRKIIHIALHFYFSLYFIFNRQAKISKSSNVSGSTVAIND